MILPLFFLCIQIIDTILANATVTLDECLVDSTADDVFNANLTHSKTFIDKTDLLADLFTFPYTNDYIACPRGFGKTTNLRMIEKFSQIEFDNNDVIPWKETRAYLLFGPLKIFQREAIVSQHLARHPVIFLDLGIIAEGPITVEKVITSLNWQLNKYWNYFKPKLRKWYLREIRVKSKVINDFTMWTNKVLQEDMREADIESSLHSFAITLHHCFGSKVMILIDDFDYFVNHAFKSIDSIGSIYSVLNKMLNNLFADFNHRVYILMAGTTSVAVAHYQFHEFMKPYSFLDEHMYTAHFGFDEDDLQKVFHTYECAQEETDYVKKYYAGYRIADKYVKFNVKSITDYFHAKEKENSTSDTCRLRDTFQKPGRKSKFIWKFFKNPNYLENVSRLIKHCPVRGAERAYQYKAFRTFLKYVKNDFKFINVSKSEMMFPFSIEQGFFAPIQEQQDAYVVANYEMRNHIMANLRLFYETHTLLDLALVSEQLRKIVVSEEPASEELKLAFSKTLTAQFKKLANFYETNFTSNFILHSIIHVAARFDGQLDVIEDYPTPVSYDDTAENVEKRCVTLVTADDAALIVKVTRAKSIQAALYKASTYQYEDVKIKRVKYLGIDVNFWNKIHVAIQAQNQTVL